ncbi:MAG: uracil-DNA glycosylase [Ilumatobacteraceae bacterium]|nr:uracil-DNA glycosylase [Ilumatobacteraceae bacterium]
MHTSYDGIVHPLWKQSLAEAMATDSARDLASFISRERAQFNVFPPHDQVFAALSFASPRDTAVVILGQDPYHERGQAHGLSFSVQPKIAIPPSLRNIFIEREKDIGLKPPTLGTLTPWAQQGVLMLNTTLTVREGEAGSHTKKGWEEITDHIIRTVNDNSERCVFLLWGAHAQAKKKLITHGHHAILEAPHPSPLSAYRGFFGSAPFSRTNALLQQAGRTPIDWSL